MSDELSDKLSWDATCPECHALITVYADETGLLPTEGHDGRWATHSWLVCELRRQLNAVVACASGDGGVSRGGKA